MTQGEIGQKMDQYLVYAREEQDLREALTKLNFTMVSEEEGTKALLEQDKIFKKIELMRNEKMLPLLSELVQVIGDQRAKQS